MSSPMFDMPQHILIAVDQYGHGPVSDQAADHWTCWCQPDGTPVRIKFNGGNGMTLCPYSSVVLVHGFPPGWRDARTKKARVMKNLAEMQAEVREVNEANGWFESDRTFGEDVALLHSEASEMLEAYRDHGTEDVTAEPWLDGDRFTTPKPEGVGSEAADVLIRLLDTCDRYGIDLAAEYERKITFNRTRGHRHGGKNL